MKNCVSCNKELSDQTHAMYHGYCLDCGSGKTSKISYHPDGTRIRKHAEVLPADSHVGPPTHNIVVASDKDLAEKIANVVDVDIVKNWQKAFFSFEKCDKIADGMQRKVPVKSLGLEPESNVAVSNSSDSSPFSIHKARAEAFQALFENLIYKNFGNDIPIIQQPSCNASRILNKDECPQWERGPKGCVEISRVKYKYVNFISYLYKHKVEMYVCEDIPSVLNDDFDKIIDEFNKAHFINNEFYSFNSKIEEYMKNRNYVFEIHDMFTHFRL